MLVVWAKTGARSAFGEDIYWANNDRLRKVLALSVSRRYYVGGPERLDNALLRKGAQIGAPLQGRFMGDLSSGQLRATRRCRLLQLQQCL